MYNIRTAGDHIVLQWEFLLCSLLLVTQTMSDDNYVSQLYFSEHLTVLYGLSKIVL